MSTFESTIPVLDMNEFMQPETRQKFVDQLSSALHEVGFFAVINTDVDIKALDAGYNAAEQFFAQPLELKSQIHVPEINGQRGYVPSERAQSFAKKDHKEFLHIGDHGNIWPTWMDLQTPMEGILRVLDEKGLILQEAISLAIGQHTGYVRDLTKGSSSLLRSLHYPSNPEPGTYWAAPHTDIDLFTILPRATEDGLQVYRDGAWIDVRVPENAFIVNGGDILENLTNGYFRSSRHQVVAKPNVERYSIVYFIHARDEADVSPLPYCVELSGGVKRFPNASEMGLLAHRLVELGLASETMVEYDAKSGLMEQVNELVKSGVAAPAVTKTHDVWQTLQAKQQ